MVSYLPRITKLKDQLAAIGTKVEDEELVPIALNGFASSWKPFVQGVCAHEKLPTFDKLWDDFVQEEIRLESCSVKKREVEDLALIGRMRKGNKKGHKKGKKEESSQGKKDLSNVKCFRCH
jgi:hypothetical protein